MLTKKECARTTCDRRRIWCTKAFIPTYPKTLPTVPKPPRASRTASLVFINLPASQTQSLVLLNRFGGQNLQRGFESPPLRQILASIRVRKNPLVGSGEQLGGSLIPLVSQLLKNLSRFTTRRSADLVANRTDLQELPELLRQIRFQCYTLFRRSNGPRTVAATLSTRNESQVSERKPR